jgi:hypothetical protein
LQAEEWGFFMSEPSPFKNTLIKKGGGYYEKGK